MIREKLINGKVKITKTEPKDFDNVDKIRKLENKKEHIIFSRIKKKK